jgi:hypothetical protein
VITLCNGNKWRLLPGDVTTDETQGFQDPETTVEEFVNAVRLLLDERKVNYSHWLQRWTEETGQWENVGTRLLFDEVFILIATKAAVLPFGVQIFVMPWGKVYASYMGEDTETEEAVEYLMNFNTWEDYVATVTNVADLPQD